MRSRSFSIAAAITLGVVGAARANRAPPAAGLELTAPPECTSRDELIARVAARSARIRFGATAEDGPALRTRVAPTGPGRVAAELTLTQPDGRRSQRRLEARTCREATDALALVIVLILDPEAITEGAATAAPAPVPAPAPPPGPLAVATPEPPAGATPPALLRRDEAAAAPAPARPHPAGRRRLAAGALLVAVSGPAPVTMPGAGVGIEGALESESFWSPAVSLSVWHARSGRVAEAGGDAELRLSAATLDLCPARLATGRLAARACALALLGWLEGRGSNTFAPRSATRPFAAAGAAIQAAVLLGWRLELRARAAAAAPLWRDAFEFTPEVFHRVASVTLIVDLGLGVRFP